MKVRPIVSVIVPAYNAEPHLAATLESLQKQSFAGFEVMIIDDGSIDGTARIAERFTLEDPRFQILRQKNGGVAAARNAGIALAQGEWIAFLDADDVWFPDKLERQLALIQEHPKCDFVFSNYFIWDGRQDIAQRYVSEKKLPAGGNFLPRLVAFNLFGISSVLVQRTLLEKAGPFDQLLAPAEDWDMWLRMAEIGFNPLGIPKPLLRYRVWPGNASGNPLKMAATNLRVLEKGLGRSKHAPARAAYEKAVRTAQGKLELASVRPWLDSDPGRVAAGIHRAWRKSPSNLKWILWYLGVKCPGWLGGTRWRSLVHKKIAQKW